MLRKEARHVGFIYSDFELFTGILSDGFDLTRKHFAASFAISMTPVLL
jgi:hypothetical protein